MMLTPIQYFIVNTINKDGGFIPDFKDQLIMDALRELIENKVVIYDTKLSAYVSIKA